VWRRWTRAASTAVVALLVVWKASLRVDCGPETGTTLSGTAVATPSAKSTFRIATFNIHGGEGPDGRFELRRTADVLRNFDLVGLNEVHGRYAWETVDQSEWLGRELGTAWLFAPTEERWWHYRFGNALLCKMPVAGWQRLPLPSQYGRSYRNLVLAEVPFQGRTVRVVVTHLERSEPRDRRAQWQFVSSLFLSLAEPAVLLGDMNSDETEPALAALLATPGVHDPLRETLGGQTPRRIDWILARGLKTTDAGVRDDGASDHPCVWAELALDDER
jgi:endonuclease/exonuclease/phosphatase family metal-dependent hydrolase